MNTVVNKAQVLIVLFTVSGIKTTALNCVDILKQLFQHKCTLLGDIMLKNSAFLGKHGKIAGNDTQ